MMVDVEGCWGPVTSSRDFEIRRRADLFLAPGRGPTILHFIITSTHSGFNSEYETEKIRILDCYNHCHSSSTP